MKEVSYGDLGKCCNILSRLSFFRTFGADDIPRIAEKNKRFLLFEKEEYVIRERMLERSFYILLSGRLEVRKVGMMWPLLCLIRKISISWTRQ